MAAERVESGLRYWPEATFLLIRTAAKIKDAPSKKATTAKAAYAGVDIAIISQGVAPASVGVCLKVYMVGPLARPAL